MTEKLKILRDTDEQNVENAYNTLLADPNIQMIDTISKVAVINEKLVFILWVFYEECYEKQ